MKEQKKSYQGNHLLKKSGVKTEWTQDLINEYIRCREDVEYFIEKYCKVIHPELGVVPFKLRDYQKEAIQCMSQNRYIALNFARQSGKTESTAGFLLHFVVFNNAKTVVIAANKREASKEVLKRIKTAYEYLPDFLKPGVTAWNVHDIAFENKSRIIAEATNGNTGRGKAVAILYCDEVAFVDNWKEFWDSVYPTISSSNDSKIILTSTSRGLNHWFNIVEGAKNKTNEFRLIEAKWNRVPGRDEAWKKKEIANSSVELFAQNHELAFLGSSGTLIAGWKLQQLSSIEPTQFDTSSGRRTYEKPVKGANYIITVDVSRGSGIDGSAYSVVDVSQSPFRVVESFSNPNLFSHEFAEILYARGKAFNDAYMLIENNDIGQEVANLLMNDYNYDNLIHSKTDGKNGITLNFGGARCLPGVRTTERSKRIGCSTLKNLIETDQLIIRDKDTIFEISNFIKHKNSYAADPNIPGLHDDLVMTLVIFSYLTDQPIFKELTATQFNKHSRFKEEMLELPNLDRMLDGDSYVGGGWSAVLPHDEPLFRW